MTPADRYADLLNDPCRLGLPLNWSHDLVAADSCEHYQQHAQGHPLMVLLVAEPRTEEGPGACALPGALHDWDQTAP